MTATEAPKQKYDWNFPVAIKEAVANGCTVIQNQPDRLLLDLDDAVALAHYLKVKETFGTYFNLVELERYTSSGGRGVHVVLQCEPMSFVNRIAIQAALGSDRKREALAMMMLRDGHEVSFLFRPKNAPAAKPAAHPSGQAAEQIHEGGENNG